ncbi:MAG: glycoside hydrolase family 44 protein [Verrucomicrobiota bacterium]
MLCAGILSFRRSFLVCGFSILSCVVSSWSQDMAIYTDSLQNTWNSGWSWSTTVDNGSTAYVHGGSKSIAATITGGWGALSFHHDGGDINTANYTALSFWIHGGATGGQLLQVYGELGGAGQTPVSLPTLTTAWQQITLSTASLGISNKSNFARFSIQDRSGAAGSAFYVDDIVLVTNGTPSPSVALTSPTSGASYVSPANISLAATVVANGHTITKVQFYNNTTLLGEDASAPYSMTWSNVTSGSYSLTARVIYDAGASQDSSAAAVTVTGATAANISVDGHGNRHAISPMIYGVAFATPSQLSGLNFTLNRSGGNSETRYNWQLNAHNHAADWYFESIDDGNSTPAASADQFVLDSKSGGAQPMLTIPMIEWMPKLGAGRGKLASFSIAKYGAQTGNDASWMPDAGNGVASPSGTNIVNDPNDANFPTNSAFENAFVSHLTNRFGVSTNGGVKYYFMDNEHSIWFSTHRDVHPVGPTMEEIRDKMTTYSLMVKSNDPNAIVLGPEEFGWSGYIYSGYDLWYGGKYGWGGTLPDRAAHGNMDYMPWLLSQLYQRSTNANVRLLDYFTLHCYPQGNGTVNEYGDDVSTAAQQLRNRSTRQFWDTSYVDPSWINSVVMLIPRMRGWANTYYPGTKIGVTEYNWGAEGHINGATAQADILGIFGRENLDLATRWTTPNAGTPCYNAMKLYRNYDGSKSTFGDTSISASGPNPDNVSTFAAIRSSDGAMTLMVVNKQLTSAAALTVNLANFVPNGTAQVWQLTSANTISRLSDLSFSGNSFSTTVPLQSITLFVLPAGSVPPAPVLSAAAMPSSSQFNFNLTGTAGQSYIIQGSSDLVSWQSIATNMLAAATTNFQFNVSGDAQYFRALWWP